MQRRVRLVNVLGLGLLFFSIWLRLQAEGGGILPKPAPIPQPGFRVLMIYKEADWDNYTQGQRNAMMGGVVGDFLRQKCVKGPDGKTPEFRRYRDNQDVSNETPLWQDAMKRPRTSYPWLLVSNPGKGGFEGMLPEKDSVAETMKILERYAP